MPTTLNQLSCLLVLGSRMTGRISWDPSGTPSSFIFLYSHSFIGCPWAILCWEITIGCTFQIIFIIFYFNLIFFYDFLLIFLFFLRFSNLVDGVLSTFLILGWSFEGRFCNALSFLYLLNVFNLYYLPYLSNL